MNQVEVKRKQIQLCATGGGLIVLWILGKQIGDNGITYLVGALEIFAMVWALISMQLPDTLGKMLRVRNSKGQFKNADKLKKCVGVFQGSLGVLFALLSLLLANVLAEKVLHIPYSRFLIMLLAPVIFFRTLNDVLEGLFRGAGSELPSAATSVLRQVLILGFGLFFEKNFVAYGEKVSKLLGQEVFTAMYGALGVVLGILLAEVLCLLFLVLIYRASSRRRSDRESDGMKTTDSFVGQIYSLYSGMPVLCGVLELLPLWLGIVLYQKLTPDKSLGADYYGVFFGKYVVVCGAVLFLLMACLLPLSVKTAVLFRKEDYRYARGAFQCGTKTVIAYALFFSVFVAVMAKQLAGAFSDTHAELLTEMFSAGSAVIFFGLLAFLCMTILKRLGKKLLVLLCLTGADVVFVVLLIAGIKVWNAGIMALVYAGLAHLVVLAVSLFILTLRQTQSTIDWLRTIAIPVGSACVSGLFCYLLGKICTPHLGNVVTLIVLLLLSFLLHWVIILFLRCYSEYEIEMTPGKFFLYALGQILGAF